MEERSTGWDLFLLLAVLAAGFLIGLMLHQKVIQAFIWIGRL